MSCSARKAAPKPRASASYQSCASLASICAAGRKNDRLHQDARRASCVRSCSQVMPPERSCSNLSSRRPSSARCVGVTGTSAGSRLSQSSPMSVRRFSADKRVISSWPIAGMNVSLIQRGRALQASRPRFGALPALPLVSTGDPIKKFRRENRVNQSGSVALSTEAMRGPPRRNSWKNNGSFD